MDFTIRWETIHPFYRMEALFLCHRNKEILGSVYDELIGISENKVMQMYYSRRDLERISRNSIKFFKNKKKIKKYIKLTEDNNYALIGIINDTINNFKHLSNKELAERYEQIILRLGYLHCSYNLSRPEFFCKIGMIINQYLKKKGR